MICGLENTTLGQGVGHLVLLDDDLLFENFNSVQLGGGLLAAQDNLTEGALAEHLEELKIPALASKFVPSPDSEPSQVQDLNRTSPTGC